MTLLAGSRSDLGDEALAANFYPGVDLRALDYTPAVASPDPLRYRGPAGTAPIHGSYEDRPGVADRVLACFDDEPSSCRSRPGRGRWPRRPSRRSTSSTCTT